MVAAYGLMETLSGRDVDHAGVLLFGAAYADVVDLCRAPPLLDPLAPNRASRVALALHLRTRTEADDNAPIVLAGLPFTVRRRFAAPLRALDCGDGSTSLARAKLLLGLTRADTTAQAALPLARALFAHLQAATLPPGAGRFDATVLHGDVIPVVAGFGPEALWRNPRARAYVPNRPHDPPAADRTKLPMYFVDLPVVDAPDSYIITDGTARLDFANFVTRGGLVSITHDEMLVRRVHRGVIADIALVAAPYQRSGGGDAADT